MTVERVELLFMITVLSIIAFFVIILPISVILNDDKAQITKQLRAVCIEYDKTANLKNKRYADLKEIDKICIPLIGEKDAK